MPGESTLYYIELLVNGVWAGAIYALISLAFVVVYKASRMINFALGDERADQTIGSEATMDTLRRLRGSVVEGLDAILLSLVGARLGETRTIGRC